jgi:hypothetical protein
MKTFKPSILRMRFIDTKIREHSYPTTVSLSIDLQKMYGDTVDPRTIASDIASLRHDFKAPIAYDFQRRGYFYTDRSFRLNLMGEKEALPLAGLVPEAFPKTTFIPEWQRALLSSMLERLLPVKRKPEAGVISILPEQRSGASERAEELLVRALHERTAMQISTHEHNLSPFYPLHIICRGEARLVLGAVPLDADTRYELLVVSAIQEITPLSDTFKPPETIYVQTSNNNDIEIVASTGNRDIILIYTKDLTEHTYKLLAKTEIFA